MTTAGGSIAQMEARLHRAWDWCEANQRDARIMFYEDRFIAELRQYEAMYRKAGAPLQTPLLKERF